MSLNIIGSLRDGVDRATNRNAGIVLVLFFFYSLIASIASNSALAAWNVFMQDLFGGLIESSASSTYGMTTLSHPLAIPMPLVVALVFAFVMWIVGEAVRVISDRTFISEETEQLHEPTRWIGWATLSSFGFAFFFTVLSVIFLFFLSAVVGLSAAVGWPGALVGLFVVVAGIVSWIILGVMFFFARQEIAARDVGPFEAITGSWSLVRENGIMVFGLGAVLALPSVMINRAELVLPDLLGQLPAVLIITTLNPVYLVFASAVVAQAYRQLRAGRQGEDSETTEKPLDPNVEWDDPPL